MKCLKIKIHIFLKLIMLGLKSMRLFFIEWSGSAPVKIAVELSKKELGGEWPKDLEWAVSKNRPYMMAIQGLGLTNWRQNNIEDAKELFKLLLDMNPNDNQGIRYCMAALYRGLTWEEFGKIEDHCAKKGEYNEVDILLKEQNELYSFWKSPDENA